MPVPPLAAVLPLPWTALLATAGVCIDQCLGEPRAGHPLVAFGRCADWLEARLNAPGPAAPLDRPGYAVHSANPAFPTLCAYPTLRRAAGLAAWVLLVVPPVLLASATIAALPFALACVAHVLLLWFALGARSLAEHLAPLGRALAAGDLPAARRLSARIVSRDTAAAPAPALARAAVESALENGSDAIFAALFWFAVAGGPGALGCRLANTLDAMWGYRTPRLLHFGWAAARLDDLANWVPARLTAASYALLGNTRAAWHCWRTQARAWDSPNAGPVMAAGAGSLMLLLGGPAVYHGIVENRPLLGMGAAPMPQDIGRALRLVQRTLLLWLAALWLLAALYLPLYLSLYLPRLAPLLHHG